MPSPRSVTPGQILREGDRIGLHYERTLAHPPETFTVVDAL
jgi:hypothetical protein